ncbi:MAG: type III pantothenate kinase [Oscillospiraceae bacterium]|nr:type III pantothenate kinase [Oscillospiraceae bacterium]
MLLSVDIGNTNISLGVFSGDELILNCRLATERQKTEDQYAIQFTDIFSLYKIDPKEITGAVLGSVVPEITNAVKGALMKLIDGKVLTLAPGVKTGLNIAIDNPAQLGADLAAGAVGAMAEYPLPAFVVDLGTATKICVVDEKKNFRGGLIAPGIAISLKALTDISSLLPTISLEAPKKVCGTNTADCMQSGIILGTASMIDGLIDKLTEEIGEPKSVIATGGLSYFLSDVCRHKLIYDKDLVLKGLKAIYEKNN